MKITTVRRALYDVLPENEPLVDIIEDQISVITELLELVNYDEERFHQFIEVVMRGLGIKEITTWDHVTQLVRRINEHLDTADILCAKPLFQQPIDQEY